jgi:hypothetical protein
VDTAPVFIKTTLDDRRVEVIGRHVCLGGVPEADRLIALDEHPNRQAILKAVPLATHMAGRLPLTMAEASVTQAALRRATDVVDGSAQAARERVRQAGWQKALRTAPNDLSSSCRPAPRPALVRLRRRRPAPLSARGDPPAARCLWPDEASAHRRGRGRSAVQGEG